MKKYNLKKNDGSTIQVDGEPVVLTGYESFNFIVHKSPSQSIFSHDKKDWDILSETSTGVMVGTGASKEDAINAALANIDSRGGGAWLDRVIRQQLVRTGGPLNPVE